MATTTRSLVALVSQVLVAATIEFDNEAERRMQHRTTAFGGRGPWLVSRVMWTNFLRFVPAEGIALGELLQHPHAASAWKKMRSWRYVDVESPMNAEALVTVTGRGRRSAEVWQTLDEEIEADWRRRFGAVPIDAISATLGHIITGLGWQPSDSLPIVGPGQRTWMLPGEPRRVDSDIGTGLLSRLSQVLVAFAVEFEPGSMLSLVIDANVGRQLTYGPCPVAELPVQTGLAKEAVAVSLSHLRRSGLATVTLEGRTKTAALTESGLGALGRDRQRGVELEKQWCAEFGRTRLAELRHQLLGLLEAQESGRYLIAEKLDPGVEGWRGRPPYQRQTAALVAAPATHLPRFPVVSHRGGYPDGS